MLRKNNLLIMFLLFGFILSNCTSKNITDITEINNDNSLQTETDIHLETAIEALLVANEFAKNKITNSELIQIIPRSVMASNLGIPPSPEGWYFVFKAKDNPIELYIEVIKGKVTGYTEAQPITTGEIEISHQPINFENLIDSDEVVDIFSTNNPQFSNFLDLELSLHYLEEFPNPVWSIYMLSDDKQNFDLLFRLDAITKDVILAP